jgi:uncharacterized phiE125 gp8 family phage protein
MSLLLLSAPAAEPVALAEAKAFLKLETDADDLLVEALLVAARMHVEAATRRLLVTQTWRCGFASVPGDGILRLPVSPVQSVLAVRLVEAPGDPVGLASANWQADVAASPPRVRLGARPGRLVGAEVDAVAGYGGPAAVPQPLRQAIRVIAATWYEERAFIGTGAVDVELPASVLALIGPYRTRALL